MTKYRSQRGGAQLAEFGPVLFVFLLMILFPLINLIGFTCGSATAWLIARECASKASNSIDFNAAEVAAQQQCISMSTSGFGKFAQLQPVQSGTSGVDLWVQAVNVKTGSVTVFQLNSPVPPPIDTTNNIYEYVAQVQFNVGPFLNMSGVPFIGSIPGVGTAAQVKYSTAQSAEYPEGVVGAGGPGTVVWGGGVGPNGGRSGPSGPIGGPGNPSGGTAGGNGPGHHHGEKPADPHR